MIVLPEPQKEGGIPLMEAISKRRSDREFSIHYYGGWGYPYYGYGWGWGYPGPYYGWGW
jgi:hypothetical protein